MKIFTIQSAGDAGVLMQSEIPAPKTMTKDDLYIRHTYVGVNMSDVALRKGMLGVDFTSIKDGIIGNEAIGIIEKVGSGVSRFSEGQRVMYCLGTLGAYAEKRVIHNSLVIPIPDDISDMTALACARRGLMAQTLLFSVFRVYKESTILIHSAAGGVGHIAASWAAGIGVRVIGTIGSEEKREIAESAKCALVLNRQTQNWSQEVLQFTDNIGVNGLYDGIGEPVYYDSLDCMAGAGVYVNYGDTGGQIFSISPEVLSFKSLFFTRPTLEHYKSSRNELIISMDAVFSAIRSGVISPVVTEYDWDNLPQAHNDLETGLTVGSVVVKV